MFKWTPGAHTAVVTSPVDSRSYDAVIFDVGGVLTVNPFAMMAKLAQGHGIEPRTFVAIAVGAGSYGDGDHPWHIFERGEITLDEYNSAIAALARQHGLDGFPPLPPAEFMAQAMALRPEMIDAVDTVRARGLRTAILTNNVSAWNSWRRFIPTEKFEVVIDSSDVGMRKPEARIYRLAVERLGVSVDRCIFLDDLAANCAAAQALGMHAILVDDSDAGRLELLRLIASEQRNQQP